MAEQRHKKMYTLQEKIAALEVMRMCGGNRQAAVRQMQAQGIHITYAALRKWEKKAHLGGTILREEAPLVNTAAQGQAAQIVDEAHAGMMTYAAKAAQTLCSALDLMHERIENKQVDNKELNAFALTLAQLVQPAGNAGGDNFFNFIANAQIGAGT